MIALDNRITLLPENVPSCLSGLTPTQFRDRLTALITKHPTVYGAAGAFLEYHPDIQEWCCHWSDEQGDYDIADDLEDAIELLVDYIVERSDSLLVEGEVVYL